MKFNRNFTAYGWRIEKSTFQILSKLKVIKGGSGIFKEGLLKPEMPRARLALPLRQFTWHIDLMKTSNRIRSLEKVTV